MSVRYAQQTQRRHIIDKTSDDSLHIYVAISLVFSLKFCNITTLALRCQIVAAISLIILATFWQRSAIVVIMLQNFNVIK